MSAIHKQADNGFNRSTSNTTQGNRETQSAHIANNRKKAVAQRALIDARTQCTKTIRVFLETER